MMNNLYTLLILIGSTKAYRPPEGSNPWHKNLDEIDRIKNDLPYTSNYVVPNFGPDEDIERIQRFMEEAPGNKDWKVVPKNERPKDHPTDYVVPNFGVDEDII